MAFVGEPIQPERESADTQAMARGEPGLPRAFTWRGIRYEIASVDAARRTKGTDRGDTYIRKHWYDITTRCGKRMTIYFDRNPTHRAARAKRWWLYSVLDP